MLGGKPGGGFHFNSESKVHNSGRHTGTTYPQQATRWSSSGSMGSAVAVSVHADGGSSTDDWSKEEVGEEEGTVQPYCHGHK